MRGIAACHVDDAVGLVGHALDTGQLAGYEIDSVDAAAQLDGWEQVPGGGDAARWLSTTPSRLGQVTCSALRGP